MKIYKLNLSLKECSDKEYVVTNGGGGYAMSTISSMNTRRYHGLLVAPINKPAQRRVLLSKIDESIEVSGNKVDLFTNISNSYISKGFDYLTLVEYDYHPKFVYEALGVQISKEIVMERGRNTTVIKYTVKTGDEDATINLTPLVTNRNFHHLGLMDNMLSFQDVSEAFGYTDVHMSLLNDPETQGYLKRFTEDYENVTLRLRAPENAEYEAYYNNFFEGMYYMREEERGFDASENLIVPGTFKYTFPKNSTEEIYIIASTEDNMPDPKSVFETETKRLKGLYNKAKLKSYNETDMSDKEKEELEEFKKALIISTDNFIISRGDLKSIIAGYPWFLDWMRDTLLSFEGLVLKTKRFDDAKDILRLAVRDIKEGLIPNGYGEVDNAPYYNSADASLLFFEAVKKYIEYTKDIKFVINELYEPMLEIISSYKFGTNLWGNNIYMNSENLLVSGSEDIQNTWMDAIVEGKVVTPRNGIAVELNAMLYNAVCIFAELSKERGDIKKYESYIELSAKIKESFNSKFISEKGGLKDLVDDDKVRPNQLFAISLSYKVVDDIDLVKSIINITKKKLYNRFGLKTLAKGEEFYTDEYSGPPAKRDFSYHQGITWPWLLIPYYYGVKYLAELSGSEEDISELKELLDKTYLTNIKNIYQKPCIMGIAEINNSVFPYEPNGTITQAWSVAAVMTLLF